MPWWLFLALLALATHTAQCLIGEFIGLSRLQLVFCLNAVSVIALLPVPLIYSAPGNAMFYVCTIGVGFLVCWLDYRMFSAFRASGAGVSTRVLSLTVFAAFVLWTLLNPGLMLDYSRTPLRLLAMVALMGAAIWLTFRMRRCPVTLHNLRELWPVVAGGAVLAVLAKYAMQTSGPEGVWYYTFLQGIVVLLVYIPLLLARSEFTQNAWDSSLRALGLGAIAGTVTTAHILSKNAAFDFVENPAYILIIVLTAPFWISLIYHIMGYRDDSDKRAGLGLVACAILFVAINKLGQ